jgi:hypothetical protein
MGATLFLQRGCNESTGVEFGFKPAPRVALTLMQFMMAIGYRSGKSLRSHVLRTQFCGSGLYSCCSHDEKTRANTGDYFAAKQ